MVVQLIAIVAVGAVVRLLNFNAVGYNSDEAVYAGQGASIAHDATLAPFFPVFRAHPLLFQAIVSIGYQLDWGDWWGRFASALFGLATIVLIFEVGRLLYGVRAGLISASILALMPYHVVVTRQVLLDGPQTFFVTLTLYLLARYAHTRRVYWLYAAGSAMGLAILAKEPSVLFCAGIYAFFALAPDVPMKIRHLLGAAVVTGDHHHPVSPCDRLQRQAEDGRQLSGLAALPQAEPLGVLLSARWCRSRSASAWCSLRSSASSSCAAGACGPGARRCSSAGSSSRLPSSSSGR